MEWRGEEKIRLANKYLEYFTPYTWPPPIYLST